MGRVFGIAQLDIEKNPDAFLQAHLGNMEPCKALWASGHYLTQGTILVDHSAGFNQVFERLNNGTYAHHIVLDHSFSVGDVLIDFDVSFIDGEDLALTYMCTPTAWESVPFVTQGGPDDFPF